MCNVDGIIIISNYNKNQKARSNTAVFHSVGSFCSIRLWCREVLLVHTPFVVEIESSFQLPTGVTAPGSVLKSVESSSTSTISPCRGDSTIQRISFTGLEMHRRRSCEVLTQAPKAYINSWAKIGKEKRLRYLRS